MKRSKHNLSNYRLLTGDMGYLYPINCIETLPGDTVEQHSKVLLRMAPMNAPVMHPVDVRVHHFFVANRNTWDGWEDFITGGPDGNDVSTTPQLTTAVTESSLMDYLGIPVGAGGSGPSYTALPIYAYNSVVNTYYLDQDIDTQRALTDTSIAKVRWEKDQFTMARPWEQKGDAVTIPLSGGSANVVRNSNAGKWLTFAAGSDTHPAFNGPLQSELTTGDLENTGGTQDYSLDPNGGLSAILTNIDALTVDDILFGLGMQKFKQARARWGSTYADYLRSLGVRYSDARLDRPEYLGGGRQTVSFSEVLQTAEGTDPVGDMKGHGIAALRSNRYRKYFEEHGYIISMLSVRPKALYMDGLARKWSRLDKEDYFMRELELVGQEEIYNKEIRAVHATPDGVFGFGNRYQGYREEPSHISGEFRSTLNYWHLGRTYTADPALNSTFLECNPSKRIFADTGSHGMWIMANNRIAARRMVRRNAVPRIT